MAPNLQFADCHNDLLLGVTVQRDLGNDGLFADFWLPQLRAGNVRLVVLPVYTEDWFTGEAALRRALTTIETARQLAQRHAADVALVTTAGELRVALDAGRIALVLAFEGLEPVGADVDLIDTFWHLGVRMASLTWNRRTPFADGLDERGTGAGLTELGLKAIARMERLGMIVDVSHLADAGFEHIGRVATRPFVASHSSCRDVYDHPRNLRDDQLLTIADRGGFVSLNAMADFVGQDSTIDTFLDHIDHAVQLVGAEHVGLGLDFLADTEAHSLPASAQPGPGSFIEELQRPADLPAFGDRLEQRLGEDAARKVASGALVTMLERLLPQ
jgi:membrane dipeptidase